MFQFIRDDDVHSMFANELIGRKAKYAGELAIDALHATVRIQQHDAFRRLFEEFIEMSALKIFALLSRSTEPGRDKSNQQKGQEIRHFFKIDSKTEIGREEKVID